MKLKVARFLSAWFFVVMLIAMFTLAQAVSLILVLGSAAGIISSENVINVGHAPIEEMTRFIMNMSIPITIFFTIVALVISHYIWKIVDRELMRRVPERDKPKKYRNNRII